MAQDGIAGATTSVDHLATGRGQSLSLRMVGIRDIGRERASMSDVLRMLLKRFQGGSAMKEYMYIYK